MATFNNPSDWCETNNIYEPHPSTQKDKFKLHFEHDKFPKSEFNIKHPFDFSTKSDVLLKVNHPENNNNFLKPTIIPVHLDVISDKIERFKHFKDDWNNCRF